MLTQLFNSYLTAKVVIMGKNEGIFDLILERGAIKKQELIERFGMTNLGASNLLDFMSAQSLIYEENGAYYMTPEMQVDVTENMGFLSWLIEAYEPVVDNAYGILSQKLNYGSDVIRKDKEMAEATSLVSFYKTDPFVFRLLDRLEFDLVIDIGCGSGQRLLQLAERYPMSKLSGIDISQKCCELAQSNINKNGLSEQINVVQSSAEDWSANIDRTRMKDGKNLIMCFAMFHDLMNIPGSAEKMLDSICRNYPSGSLLLIQDQMRTESVRVGQNNWVEGFTFVHRLMGQSLYPVSQYKAIMERHGFRIVETVLTDISENYLILAEVK